MLLKIDERLKNLANEKLVCDKKDNEKQLKRSILRLGHLCARKLEDQENTEAFLNYCNTKIQKKLKLEKLPNQKEIVSIRPHVPCINTVICSIWVHIFAVVLVIFLPQYLGNTKGFTSACSCSNSTLFLPQTFSVPNRRNSSPPSQPRGIQSWSRFFFLL